MKNLNFKLKKSFLIPLIMLFNITGFAQTHFTVWLANVTSTSTTLEVDVMFSVDAPVDGVRLSTVSVGINYDAAILNGGTPCSIINCGSWAYVSGKSAIISSLIATGNTTKSPYGHLRIVGIALSGASSIDIPKGTYTLGRYRLTNTVPWTSGSDAKLWLSQTGGSVTNTIFSAYPFGSVTPIADYTVANLGVTLNNTSLSPLNYILTPTPCGPGATKTWFAGAWSPSEPTENDSAIIGSDFTSTGDINACSLTVNNNAIVTVHTGHNFNIYNAVTVETGASLTFENNANLFQTNNSSVNSGNITVKRDSNALLRFDYTLWSSPVLGQNLFTFSPLTSVTPSSRFYTYNPTLGTSGLYSAITDPAATNFAVGTGYLIRMPNTASAAVPTKYNGEFTGVPNNGIIIVATTAGLNTKYNAIGNPYPSRINAAAFKAANPDITTLYYWRKTNNINQGTSPTTSYATYNIATTIGVGVAPDGVATGQPTIVPDVNIQVGQGFLVSTAQSNIVFNNGMRLFTTGDKILKTKALAIDRIWLNLSNSSWPINQTALCYMDGASQDVDETDSRYFNDSQTALNSLINNEEYVIQGRSLPFDGTDVVPLAFKTTNTGNFTISIDLVEGVFSGSQDIFLRDNSNGVETDLKAGPYAFTAVAGVDNARFSLKYQKTLKVFSPVFNENSITVYKNKGTIYIKSGNTVIDNVKLFDIRGRLVYEKAKINATITAIEGTKFATQVLIAKITSKENKVVY